MATRGQLSLGGPPPSLAEMSASTGRTPQNKTSIKPPKPTPQPGVSSAVQPGMASLSQMSRAPTMNGMSPTGGQLFPAPTSSPSAAGQPGMGGLPPASTPQPGAAASSGQGDGLYDSWGQYTGPGALPRWNSTDNTDPNAFVGTLGDGATDFNPGMTNPDGSNSTVPRGSRDGTSPAVYRLMDQNPDLVASMDPGTVAGIEALVNNTQKFSDMDSAQRERILNAVQGLVSQGRFDWNTLAGNQFFRDEYAARFGDPVQSSVGATENTVNPSGSVQGQFEGERGGAFQAISSDAASQNDMGVAAASRNDRTVGDQEMSSNQLNDILRTGSPLMTLARQDAIEAANRMGLRNSSLAVGAQMAEMARQAMPMAQQQAEAFRQAGSQNQALESERRMFNADSENRATSQEFATEAARRDANASRQTSVSQGNAAMGNDMMNADRQRDYGYNLQQLAGDQDMAKQRLAAQTAADVANIEGQYKQMISENDTAARMFDSYYQTVQNVMSNPEFGQPEAQSRLDGARAEFEAGMQMILGFENFDLQNPAAGGEQRDPTPGVDTPQEILWDNMSDDIRSQWESMGYTRGTFPGFGGGPSQGGGIVNFPGVNLPW